MPETAEMVAEELQAAPQRFVPGRPGRGVQRKLDKLTARVYAAEGKYNAARRDLLDTVSIAWQLLSRCEKQLAPADRLSITNGLRSIEEEHGR